ncbi:MAG TPA: hypothetical protein VMV32_08270 [Ignavibacteriaceae bacterium]|nr:hypothetical protein [Ignavibacteriaceae bacterium]
MTYRQILKQFGFERVTGKDRVKGIINFTHPKYDWYAEIIKYEYSTSCWIVGGKIRNSSYYPRGCHCDTPKDLMEELHKAENYIKQRINLIKRKD